MSQLRAIYFLVVLSLVGLAAWAGVPQLINFQGQLKNSSGSPLVNDTLAVEFKIYDDVSAGNVKWSEVDTVITDANGLFTILLGTKTPIPDSAFNDSLRWLGIKVGSDPEISPRSQLSSVGYSYVSSQWTSAGQDLFRLNGNVGIGTGSPSKKLHISLGTGQGLPLGNTFAGLRINNNASATDEVSMELIAGSSGSAHLHFGDNSSVAEGTIRYDNLTNAMYLGANGGEKVVIGSTGNIGIGTGSPSKKLHISLGTGQGLPLGNNFAGLRINNNASATDEVSMEFIAGSSGSAYVHFGDNSSVAQGGIRYSNLTDAMYLAANGGEKVVIASNGNVGIGTANPSARLHVKGANFPNSFGFFDTDASNQDAGLRFQEAGVVKSHLYHQASTNTLNLYGEGFSGISINSVGRVGIGTTAPAALLHVNGTAGNNTGVWSNLSDRRLKKEIEPITSALGTVEQLQGVSFRWKDPQKDAQFGRVRGLIAQDVEKVIPEWIKTDPDGYKRIEPIGIDALLIEAIKDQQKQIEELKAEIAKLKTQPYQAQVEN